MYIAQEEVVHLLHSQEQNFVIVDTRDEDYAGGSIRGALHLADGSDWSHSMPILLAAIAEKQATMVIFHCMESIRRGPRCARRLYNYFLDNEEEDDNIPALRILQGGADQWIRKFYKTDLVELYDDEYWAFEEFPPDEQQQNNKDEEEEDVGICDTIKNKQQSDIQWPVHSLYSRPSDQHIDAAGNDC